MLKSGKMPAPTNIVSEETVGPSLGAASIQAGFTACVVAFVLLMIFMCAFYGFIPGMVANSALIINFFFTFGVLTSFQAALTLSGLARYGAFARYWRSTPTCSSMSARKRSCAPART